VEKRLQDACSQTAPRPAWLPVALSAAGDVAPAPGPSLSEHPNRLPRCEGRGQSAASNRWGLSVLRLIEEDA